MSHFPKMLNLHLHFDPSKFSENLRLGNATPLSATLIIKDKANRGRGWKKQGKQGRKTSMMDSEDPV